MAAFAIIATTAISAFSSMAAGAAAAQGAMLQAQAVQQAGLYNAKIAERNALIAEQNRQLVIRQTDIEAEDTRRENRRNLAAMRAAFGASGLELAGSPLDVLEDTAIEQELDVQRIEFEGRVRAREAATKVTSFRQEAHLNKMEAAYAIPAGRLRSRGFLLEGLSGAASSVGRGVGQLADLSRTG